AGRSAATSRRPGGNRAPGDGRAAADRLPRPLDRRSAPSPAASRSGRAGVGAADARRRARSLHGDRVAPRRAGRPRAADPALLGSSLALQPALGPAAARRHGRHRRAPARGPVGGRPAAAQRRAVGIPEWPRAEPGRLLRSRRVPARHPDRAPATLPDPRLPAVRRDGLSGRGEPHLPRHALALRRDRRLRPRHRVSAARALEPSAHLRPAARRRGGRARLRPSRRVTTTPRADVVGSLLRPTYLREARQGAREGRVTAEVLREAEDRAVREAIALQEVAGLDVITDGELRRSSWVITIPLREEGLARAPLAG